MRHVWRAGRRFFTTLKYTLLSQTKRIGLHFISDFCPRFLKVSTAQTLTGYEPFRGTRRRYK